MLTASSAERPGPSFEPALPALAAAAETHPVVLVGELHGWSDEHRFLRRLVAHLAERDAIDDVVVEFGNARHQRLVDAYVRGAPVPERRVERAWLETTQGSVWSAPDYAAFFHAVRALNKRLAPERRLRVLLGDPPIDPSKPNARNLDLWLGQRDIHFATVIQREVVARGRRALVIAGIGHVLRRPRPHPTLANLLEGHVSCEPDPLAVAAGVNWCDDLERYPPTKTYVVVPHQPTATITVPHDERPALAAVEGTSLGELPLAALGGVTGAAWTIEEAIDAYLVLGGRSR